MAGGSGLGEFLRRAVDAQVAYYRSIARLTADYGSAVAGTLRSAAETTATTAATRAARSASATTMAPPAPTGHAGHAGHAAHPAAPPPTSDSTPAGPVIALEGEAGSAGIGMFLVENHTRGRVSAPVSLPSLRDPEGREIQPELRFEPEVVTLDPGEQVVVQMAVAIVAAYRPGVDYRGAVSVPGLVGTSIPVVLRRLVPPPAPKRRNGEGQGGRHRMTGASGGTAQGVLVSVMWSYAASVLRPAQAFKRQGLWSESVAGDLPVGLPRKGLGPWFSERNAEPVLSDVPGDHDEDVEEFDRIAEVYAAFVRPFSTPLFDEALAHIATWIGPDARVLDAGCGSGQELERVARLVPDGEIVGCDLAAGMVKAAWRGARAHGLDNGAFFQADVARLPAAFTGRFDLVYCCLAHHHYPEPALAAAEALRSLRPGGVYCIVDPGPEWYVRLSSALARWADPGWVGFHTPRQFRDLLSTAGFERTAWIDLLPGFGLAVGQKAKGAARTG